MTDKEREEAIKNIDVIEKRYATLDKEERKALYRAKEALSRPTGHWIIDIDKSRTWDWRMFYCSECGDWQTYGETKFCPNCGMPMGKERTE